MPKEKKQVRPHQEAEIARLKDEYIRYYADLPVQRLAAGFIGRNEDTIINWRKEDLDFAERVTKAESEWARSKVKYTRDTKFLLERILKKDFAQKVEIESNQPTAITFTYVLPEHQNQPDAQAAPDVAE